MRIINEFKRKLINFIRKKLPFPKIVNYKTKGEKKLIHISAFSYGNSGDTLLPIVLRDLFNFNIDIKKWLGIHVHTVVTEKVLFKINKSNGLVIGGGGLFLKDTNPNNLSGWQWSCSIDNLEKIKVPIIAFAVGYNRFRGQSDFDPIFTKHLNKFVERAVFIGIRNTGSINALKKYLTKENSKKLVFQPCMTTLIAKLYPKFNNYIIKEDFIAINCAFDRVNLRGNSEKFYESIAKVAKELSSRTKIKYYSHMPSDKNILKIFDKIDVPYELVELGTPKNIIMEYSKPRLVIGMRGHAQMIPFGCMTPILSIISHNKMKWFLDDISQQEWGVDVLEDDFEDKLLNKALLFYSNFKEHIKKISEEQHKLYDKSITNLNKISNLIENYETT